MTTETLAESPSTTTAGAPVVSASSALSVTSLVLSILAIALGQGVLAVAGVILGLVARRREPASRTTANWGVAIGFVALFGWIVLAMFGLAVATPFLVSGYLFGAF